MKEDSKDELMVTIRCLAYNHEPYIRQCLEGFVMQKTNFRFEAIVHDDASTDRTAVIIKEYAEKYPDIIKPIFETENQYSKRDGSIIRIMDEHTHGRYVALCEGDDCWIDPLKLQKQVDFLENHMDFSMCFHKAYVQNNSKNSLLNIDIYNHLEEREYTGSEILKKWSIPTASVLARKGVLRPLDGRFIYGDIVFFLSCAEVGRIFCLKDPMSVYRRNDKGVTRKKIHYKKYLNHYDAILEHFGEKYANIISSLKVRSYVLCFIGARKSKNDAFEILKDVFRQRHLIIPFCLFLTIRVLKSVFYKMRHNHYMFLLSINTLYDFAECFYI